MHVVTVVYEFNAGPISDKGQRSRRSSISGLNWRGGCSLQQGLVSWRHRLNQHSQLAVTMLLRSVVMEYQQRRDFLVDPHNRIAHENCGPRSLFFLSFVVMFIQGSVGFSQEIYVVTRLSGRDHSG